MRFSFHGMLTALFQRPAGLPRWLRSLLISVATVAIVLQWMNTRVAILRMNQNPAHPVVLATYPVFHSMATGMREAITIASWPAPLTIR